MRQKPLPHPAWNAASPFLLALALYALTLGFLFAQVWRIDRGVQLYGLDDPYIHLAIAKNLVRHGVYGVTPAAFSAAASSIIWPFLLAALMVIFGVKAWVACLLNILCAVALLLMLDRWLSQLGASVRVRGLALAAIVLCTPLAGITSLGLEHILHALTATGLLIYACKQVERPAPRTLMCLAIWSLCACLSRYEAAFEVACVCALLVLSRQLRAAVTTAVAGFLPMLGFGLFSLAHPGSHFFPNSLLIKTHRSLTTRADVRLMKNFNYMGRHLILFAVVALLLLTVIALRRSRRLTGAVCAGTIAMGAWCFQVLFADTGSAGRYEAFLVVLFIVSIALLISEIAADNKGYSLRLPVTVAVLGVAALVPRGWVILVSAARAVESIYLQQYQMARFFAADYPGVAVGNNDIGAVDFYTETANLDVFGLASSKVLNAVLANRYDPTAMRTLADEQNVRVIAIYTSWFQALPPSWTFAGSLTPKCPGSHSTVGGSTVSFYATHPGDQSELTSKLKAFASRLPTGDAITHTEDSSACLH